MEVERFRFHRRADMALNELSPADQAAVRERLAALADVPPRQWDAREVTRQGATTPLYLVRVDDSLRALIDLHADRAPEVLDIVRQETLESFARAGR